jgi:hypothetical protein
LPVSALIENAVRARQLLPARQLCPGLPTGAFLFKHLKSRAFYFGTALAMSLSMMAMA